MISKEDIQGLAKLARLELSDADLPTLGGEIGHILAFVEVIQKAEVPAKTSAPLHRNVMREDGTPHEGNLHTETLLSAAPAREGNRIMVKQVISRTRKR